VEISQEVYFGEFHTLARLAEEKPPLQALAEELSEITSEQRSEDSQPWRPTASLTGWSQASPGPECQIPFITKEGIPFGG